MFKTLIRGVCWLAVFGGCCQLIALLGTWTGIVTVRAFASVLEWRWYYDDPDDALKILSMAAVLLIAGYLGIRFVLRPRGRWVRPIWPERE